MRMSSPSATAAPARPTSLSPSRWPPARRGCPSASSPHRPWCTNCSRPATTSDSAGLQKQLAKIRLLVIDELGYVPLSPTGAELLMVEAHRYRVKAGFKAIAELKPKLGPELTATPKTVGASSKDFKNVIYQYGLGEAMQDGYVKRAGFRRA